MVTQLFEGEDVTFMTSYNLDEKQFLSLFSDGLAGYTLHRLDRARARGTGYDIPKLRSIESQQAVLRLSTQTGSGVTAEGLAKALISEQVKAVHGALEAARIKRAGEAEREEHAGRRLADKAARLKVLAEKNPFGWKPDSRSAREWAEAELERTTPHKGA
jgi:hypothetical protein